MRIRKISVVACPGGFEEYRTWVARAVGHATTVDIGATGRERRSVASDVGTSPPGPAAAHEATMTMPTATMSVAARYRERGRRLRRGASIAGWSATEPKILSADQLRSGQGDGVTNTCDVGAGLIRRDTRLSNPFEKSANRSVSQSRL